jgi:hypothetical protein
MARYVPISRVMELPANARRLAVSVIAAGAAVAAYAVPGLDAQGWSFALYILLSLASSGVKFRMESIQSYFTLNFIFLLAGVAYFSLAQTVVACCVSGLGMSLLNFRNRPARIQVAYNVATLVLSGSVAHLAAHRVFVDGFTHYRPAWFAIVTTIYFVTNTLLVAGIVSLATGESFRAINARYYLNQFPYYVLGAAAVGVLPFGEPVGNAESLLLLLPLAYMVNFFRGLSHGKANGAIAAVDRTVTVAPAGGYGFACAITVIGTMLGVLAIVNWESRDGVRFAVFTAAGTAASFLRVNMPGIRGTITAGFVLVVAAVVEMSLPEILLMAAFTALPAAFAKTRHRGIDPLAAVTAMMLSATVAAVACRWLLAHWLASSVSLALLAAAMILYSVYSLLIAIAISLAEGRSALAVFHRFFFWGLSYCFVGSAAAGLIVATWRSAGWAPSLLMMPILALLGISYQLQVRNAASVLAKA